MLTDVLVATRKSTRVDAVTVVTADEEVAAFASGLGVPSCKDAEAGLNASFLAVLASLPSWSSRALLLLGDLPCLTGEALDVVLGLADDHTVAAVPDAAMVGTTMLAINDTHRFAPRFGQGSLGAHATSGAAVLQGCPAVARADVDTVADLKAAVRLGVQQQTGDLLAAWGSAWQSVDRQDEDLLVQVH